MIGGWLLELAAPLLVPLGALFVLAVVRAWRRDTWSEDPEVIADAVVAQLEYHATATFVDRRDGLWVSVGLNTDAHVYAVQVGPVEWGIVDTPVFYARDLDAVRLVVVDQVRGIRSYGSGS